jgi:ribosomal protein S18 acetylase RimI-like enzyme
VLYKSYEIIPINESLIEGYRKAVDSVAKERKYLAFLQAPAIEKTRAFVLENLKGNWPHVVAMVNNKVVGWCDIASLGRPVFAHSGCLGVGVIQEYRGQGIGEALLRKAIELAKLKGLTRIELTVREHNTKAIALYKKLGFEIEGLHRKAVLVGGEYENHLSMALLF